MKTVGFQAAERLLVWAFSDGRAGIENQALGLAEAIGRRTPISLVTKRVQLRTPWNFLPSEIVLGPRLATTITSDDVNPPWPDIFIGCGRASIPFALGMRSWSRERSFVVQLQDPRINPREFDLVIPPVHDGLESSNVLPIVGACHRVTPDRIAEEAAAFTPSLSALPGPRLAVLIGGKSKRQDISAKRARAMSEALVAAKAQTGGSLLVTLSRRTSDDARAVFREVLAPQSALFFEGEGPNPYFAMLGAADHIFVTADSVNMATEAAATGKPIHILAVDGQGGKLDAFHKSLAERGCARPFDGKVETWSYTPLLETERAAAAVLEAWSKRVR